LRRSAASSPRRFLQVASLRHDTAGRYEDLGAAHVAVIDWCDLHGLQRVGVRWEIYGHWVEDSPEQGVDVFHLLA
jgi:hypothetical protein